MEEPGSLLITTANYTLSGKLQPTCLYLHLRTAAGCFHKTLSSLEMDSVMGQWLQTLEELCECLRDEGSIQVEPQGVIRVYGRVGKLRKAQLEIGVITLDRMGLGSPRTLEELGGMLKDMKDIEVGQLGHIVKMLVHEVVELRKESRKWDRLEQKEMEQNMESIISREVASRIKTIGDAHTDDDLAEIRQKINAISKQINDVNMKYEALNTNFFEKSAQAQEINRTIISRIQANQSRVAYLSASLQLPQQNRLLLAPTLQPVPFSILIKQRAIEPAMLSPKKQSNTDQMPLPTVQIQTSANEFEDHQYICLRTPCSRRIMLSLNNPNIISSGRGKVYVFGRRALRAQDSISLRIRRIESFISVGVCEFTEVKPSEFSTHRRLLYWNEGSFYDGQSELYNVGHGFGSGDIVRMEADLHSGIVSWHVGNKKLYSFESEMLRVGQWSPVIILSKMNDSFEWLS